MGETRRWGSQQWQTGQICTDTLGLLGTYLGTVNDQSPFFKECGSHTLLIGPPWTLIPSGCYLPSPYNISPSPSTNFKEHCRNNPPPPPNLPKRKTNNTQWQVLPSAQYSKAVKWRLLCFTSHNLPSH